MIIKQKINSLVYIILANCVYFLLSIVAIINLPQYFWWRLDTYNVYQNFLLTNKLLLQSKFQTVLDMMNLRTNVLDANFFSREDIIHMQDVQKIMIFVFLILFITAVFFIINLLVEDLHSAWQKNAKYALLTYFGLVLVIGTPFLINFNASFIFFHQLFFRNQYWILDPATSNLIKFLPEVIFQEIVMIILSASAALAVLNYLLALLLNKFKLKL